MAPIKDQPQNELEVRQESLRGKVPGTEADPEEVRREPPLVPGEARIWEERGNQSRNR